MDFRRYAIFVTPPPGPLADATAAWLGWDAAAGVEVAHPEIKGLPRAVGEITATPRKYGFHGTIKPPFRLAQGGDAAGLLAALRALCDGLAPVTLDGLEVTALGRFVVLQPVRSQVALADLAGAVVAGLDGFRAPPTLVELTRRRAAGLSDAQDALLLQWGYPFVMEEFRYHMTLTGRLSAAVRAPVIRALEDYLGPYLPAPCFVEDLTLLGEGEDGLFRHIARVPLRGGADQCRPSG